VFLLIGKTSALTMNIAGVIKDWLLIFCSYYLFRAPVTALNMLGYAFCCTGVRTAPPLAARPGLADGTPALLSACVRGLVLPGMCRRGRALHQTREGYETESCARVSSCARCVQAAPVEWYGETVRQQIWRRGRPVRPMAAISFMSRKSDRGISASRRSV